MIKYFFRETIDIHETVIYYDINLEFPIHPILALRNCDNNPGISIFHQDQQDSKS